MVNFFLPKNSIAHRRKPQRTNNRSERYKKLASMGKVSVGIIDEICGPIDAVNRFINLTLQTTEENSQGREFLLESKKGIRKTLVLLKRLNNYAKRIEKEISEISAPSKKS